MYAEAANDNQDCIDASVVKDMCEESTTWYAVYTRSKCEKRVNTDLQSRGIETYFPLYPVRRRWSDRVIELMVPLFPSYLFANLQEKSDEFFAILNNKGVVRILGNRGRPMPIPESEIATIKRVLLEKLLVKSIPWLQEGKPVHVVAGPLAGMKGVIERHGRKGRLYIAVESLGQSIVADIDARDVRAL